MYITLNIYDIHNLRLCCQRQADKRPKVLISDINHDELLKLKRKEEKEEKKEKERKERKRERKKALFAKYENCKSR